MFRLAKAVAGVLFCPFWVSFLCYQMLYWVTYCSFSLFYVLCMVHTLGTVPTGFVTGSQAPYFAHFLAFSQQEVAFSTQKVPANIMPKYER